MPNIDWDNVEEAEDFRPLPEGQYLCTLVKIEERQTNAGDPMWGMEFKVADGEFRGRAIWDNLPFSKKGLTRVKLVCSRFGLETTGKVNLVPEMILNKDIYVDVEHEQYENKIGQTRTRHSVPFAGYSSSQGAKLSRQNPLALKTDDVPF